MIHDYLMFVVIAGFMSKKNRLKSNNISHMLVYILGHRPFEFGLLPDIDGFVACKDLIQALHEESGWGYIKQGNINEVLIGEDRPLFEAVEGRIRTVERRWAFNDEHLVELPSKILFLGIRRKAHPVVMERGLRRIEGSFYILSPDREMAERIGRRRDPQTVILDIMADAAQSEGLVIRRFGDLFLAQEIPARFIAGPPVPKSVTKAREEKESKKKEQEGVQQFQAGSFLLDIEKVPSQYRKDKGRKKRSWKEGARKERRKMRIIPW
jgi:putative RNA 2'-phosphotransferase